MMSLRFAANAERFKLINQTRRFKSMSNRALSDFE